MDYEVGKGKPPKHTQFKKGQSGNPEGARRHDSTLKVIRNLNSHELANVVNILLNTTVPEIEKIVEDDSYPFYIHVIGRATLKSLEDRSMEVIEKLMDRIIGKPRQQSW